MVDILSLSKHQILYQKKKDNQRMNYKIKNKLRKAQQ